MIQQFVLYSESFIVTFLKKKSEEICRERILFDKFYGVLNLLVLETYLLQCCFVAFCSCCVLLYHRKFKTKSNQYLQPCLTFCRYNHDATFYVNSFKMCSTSSWKKRKLLLGQSCSLMTNCCCY